MELSLSFCIGHCARRIGIVDPVDAACAHTGWFVAMIPIRMGV